METEEELAERLGAAIRRARATRRSSQATLAEKLEVSVDYLGMIERGERLPSFAVLVRAANLFGTTVSALLGAPATTDEAWVEEVLALLRAIPPGPRETTIAMLRGVAGSVAPPAEAETAQRSGTRPRRRR